MEAPTTHDLRLMSFEAVASVTCPRCDAGPGRDCRTDTGWVASPHLARRKAAWNWKHRKGAPA